MPSDQQLVVTKRCLRTDFSRPLSVVADLPELDNALKVDGQHATATLLTRVHDLGIQGDVVNRQVNVWTRPGQVPPKRVLQAGKTNIIYVAPFQYL